MNDSLRNMPVLTKAYILAVAGLGLTVLATQLAPLSPEDPVRFAIYLIITAIAAGFKISLPGIPGTMSASYVLFLLGFMQLSLPETLLMGLVSTAVGIWYRAKNRPRLVQILFNFASMTISVAFGHWVFHSGDWISPAQPVHPALAVAASAFVFFFANTVSIAVVIALVERLSPLRVWKQSYLWSLPYYLMAAGIAMAVDYCTRWIGWEISLLLLPLLYVIFNTYRLYWDRLEQEKNHAQQMADLHLRTIQALALAIEAKDDTTHEHLCRVQVYAVEIGRELGLDEEQLQAVQAAAILHDIGKLAVPDYIISKPGRLTPEEFEKMKIHPVVGAQILERVRFPYPVAPIVRSHHEKWNGAGYPDGLRGEEIPVGARILAAVDCLDALASDRQYRAALPLEEALRIVASESGISFDPRVVDILCRRSVELENKARARSIESLAPKLDKDIKVERGLAPAAGFEKADTPVSSPGQSPALGFLESIAAAHQEMQGLYELVHELGNSLNLPETLSVLCTRLRRLIPHDAATVWLREGRLLRPCFVAGENARFFSSLEIPVGQGLSGWVAENSKPIVNGNPEVESGYLNDPSRFTTLRSALSIPLTDAGNVDAVLTLYSLEKDAFHKDHLRLLLAISHKLSMAVLNARRFQQVEEAVAFDRLTGLPNARALFLHLDSELSRCRRSEAGLSVLVCDLDGFRQINDRFGQIAGDEVLRLLGERMKEQCREYDCVARMGGDEFVLVLPEFPKEGLVQKIGLLESVARQVSREVCGESLLNLSTGCAAYPDDGRDADQLLAAADQRLQKAKISSRAPEPALSR